MIQTWYKIVLHIINILISVNNVNQTFFVLMRRVLKYKPTVDFVHLMSFIYRTVYNTIKIFLAKNALTNIYV